MYSDITPATPRWRLPAVPLLLLTFFVVAQRAILSVLRLYSSLKKMGIRKCSPSRMLTRLLEQWPRSYRKWVLEMSVSSFSCRPVVTT